MPFGTEQERRMSDESEQVENARDERVRAVIADDDPFARRVIKDALTESGVMIIAEARDGRQAVEYALYYRPDVVIMDVVMPELDGISATRQILKAAPDQLVIVLSGADDEDSEIGLLALRAGAAGFLSKDVDFDTLPRTLEGVVAGEAAISRRLTKLVIEQLRSPPGGSSPMRPAKSPLTAREWEVIDLLKATRSTDEIAAELVLSTETVRSHVKNVLRKLKVRSREEAVAVADRIAAGQPSNEEESTRAKGDRRRGRQDRRRSRIQRAGVDRRRGSRRRGAQDRRVDDPESVSRQA
jgi:DNA-binding NarL/FixJ family response regulator